jgi:hypothetical protein
LYGHVKSCGCFQKERAGNTSRTHGLTKSRLYTIWSCIKRRCFNVNDVGYKKYGAKGITMCHEWKNDFITFRNWALANGYKDDLSIDRFPDQKGNYEPSNCRWATQSQQARNTKRNYLVTFNGETKCLIEWAEVTGISREVLKGRLQRYGWSVEEALTTPARPLLRKSKAA